MNEVRAAVKRLENHIVDGIDFCDGVSSADLQTLITVIERVMEPTGDMLIAGGDKLPFDPQLVVNELWVAEAVFNAMTSKALNPTDKEGEDDTQKSN